MVKAKRYSEADLADFYSVSPVFKKYSHLHLWSENFSEYHNLKYCEVYLSQYILGFTKKYILEYFSKSFLLTLQNSQNFLKFIKSGFFKYIDYHFLLMFQNNCFFCFEESHKEVEIFVEEYFQRYIQNFFERDLLMCLVTCIHNRVPKSFDVYLNNRLKSIYNELLFLESNIKFLPNSVAILNFTESKRGKYHYLGFIDYKKTIKKIFFSRVEVNTLIKRKCSYPFIAGFTYKIYKSLNTIKEISGVIKSSFLSFFLEDTIYNWGYSIINSHKKTPSQTLNYLLVEVSKTSEVFKYITLDKKVEYYLKVCSALLLRYSWCFYTFTKCIYKLSSKLSFNATIKKGSNNCNDDFHALLWSSKVLVRYYKRKNDIGIYRESTNVFF
uniref:Uncharacterized protein n=1 Tax=Saccharina sculpera TaxID=416830 RepID=A0A0U2LVX4_9PHAE|nr:hypothetical protein MOGBL39 [Saccharina sculpera]ALI31102.1 hypothetical protein MOGBL39 [Saccharina sculpera]